jgi:RNA polymerase sigma-70 factor (ECF subfamily)
MSAEFSDDVSLASRVAAGDRSALEALYARYAEPLYAFICHHLDGSKPEVEEIWQETLLCAVRSLPGYRGRSGLFTWLCGIARRKIADELSARARPTIALSQLAAAELDSLIDAGPIPEEVLVRKETRLRVVAALASLPEEYRRGLVARYADGRSVQEVAGLLGKTYKATESLLARARSAFRAALSRADRNRDLY